MSRDDTEQVAHCLHKARQLNPDGDTADTQALAGALQHLRDKYAATAAATAAAAAVGSSSTTSGSSGSSGIAPHAPSDPSTSAQPSSSSTSSSSRQTSSADRRALPATAANGPLSHIGLEHKTAALRRNMQDISDNLLLGVTDPEAWSKAVAQIREVVHGTPACLMRTTLRGGGVRFTTGCTCGHACASHGVWFGQVS